MSKLILSLDGGGIRGAATTQFLRHLEEDLSRNGTSIRERVDLYAGTSTGSIIALCLATTALGVDKINELYNFDNAREIFAENRGFLEIDGVNAPKYEADGKTRLLRDNMGEARIGDVPRDKHVLAVTYGIERRKPEVIKSSKEIHRELYSYQVADASSAAPTYFPTKEMDIGGQDEEFWLVDGGVTANNPTMCAIAEAKAVWRDVPVEELRVLSVGTGYRTRKINGPESRKWGALQWFTKGNILDLLTDERVVAYQAGVICKEGGYIRVNAEMKPQPGLELAPDDAMDDISKKNIKRLKELGDFWYAQYKDPVLELILDTYQGPSLDRIDPQTGHPVSL